VFGFCWLWIEPCVGALLCSVALLLVRLRACFHDVVCIVVLFLSCWLGSFLEFGRV